MSDTHILYVCFKTLMTAEINFKKLGRDGYMEKTSPVALAFAVDDGEAQCEMFPFSEELNENARGVAIPGEDWLVMGHNIDFHRHIWTEKLKWPTPWKFGCTVLAAKKTFPQLKSHALDSLVEHFKLPPRFKIDEAGVMGGYTPEEMKEAAIRDVCLCRAVSELVMRGEVKSVIQ